MPIDSGIYRGIDTQFGKKLSDLFDPYAIQQKQSAADEQNMANQLRQMQVLQGVEQMRRAPVLAQREEQQWQAKQAEAQRLQQEQARRQAMIAQLPEEQRRMIELGISPEKVLIEKKPDWQNPEFEAYEARKAERAAQLRPPEKTPDWKDPEYWKAKRGQAQFEAGLKQPNPMVELKMQEMASGKEMAKKQQSLSAQQVLDQAATLYAHPGREMATGVSSFMSAVPGTEARGFKANLDTFKAQTFVPMVSALKGMGALSDAEGKKLSESVGALDPGMSEKEFASSLASITKYLYEKSKAAGLDVSMPEFIGSGAKQSVSPAKGGAHPSDISGLLQKYGR